MNTRLRLALVIVLSGFALAAHAQTAADEFERGNGYYREGKFDQAAEAYEAILRQGVASAAIYFDLGNSYYRLGKIAPAILAYERALRLQPNDQDVQHNLDLVNLKTQDRIEPLPELFFIGWLRSVSAVVPLQTTMWLFGIAWFFCFGSFAALYLFSNPSLFRILRGIALAALVLLVPLGILLATQVADSRSHNDAIVTSSVVTAKSSPDAEGVDAFVIHEGLKVTLSDAVGDWVKIALADGKVGWIRSSECERI